MIAVQHHVYFSMIPIGLKPGILVGVLLAAGVAGGDIEGHYLTIGTAVAIFSAVAISAWNLSSKFRRILDQLEESKKDRETIHRSLEQEERETAVFRDKVDDRLLSIDKTIAGLSCNRGQKICPEDAGNTQ